MQPWPVIHSSACSLASGSAKHSLPGCKGELKSEVSQRWSMPESISERDARQNFSIQM